MKHHQPRSYQLTSGVSALLGSLLLIGCVSTGGGGGRNTGGTSGGGQMGSMAGTSNGGMNSGAGGANGGTTNIGGLIDNLGGNHAGSSNAGSSAGGSPGAAGAASTADMCPTDADDSACGICIKGECCDSVIACAVNMDCSDLLSCVANCTTDACVQSCGNSFPAGVTPLNTYTSCASNSCGTECGTGGSGGSGGASGGTAGAGNGGDLTTCGNGAAVFCFCAEQLGAGACTEDTIAGAILACQGGDPIDLATTISCSANYYISTEVPPDCDAFANGCL